MKHSVHLVLTLVLCLVLSISGVLVSVPAARAGDAGTWTAMNASLRDLDVAPLAISPLTPTTLYDGGGVSRSTDSGTTWTASHTEFAYPRSGMTCLTIDPVTLSTLYTLTAKGIFPYETTSSYRCSVGAFPSEGGSVSKSPSAYSYAPGTLVTCTATPWPGYIFKGWSGTPPNVETRNPTITVTVDADLTIVAVFSVHPTFTLTPSAGTGGTITPNTPQTVSKGDSYTFTITPDTGYHVSSVVVNGTSVGTMTSYTFTNLAADHTITVSFAAGAKRVIELKIGSGTMYVDGGAVSLEAPPIILNSRTFLPIRAIGEGIGAFVSWDAPTQKVTVTRGGNVLEFMIDWPQAKLNGWAKKIDPHDMDVVPVIMNGRTLLPLRFVAEALGLDVVWDPTTKKITIVCSP